MSIVYLRFQVCRHICPVDLWQGEAENAARVDWIMSQGECNDCAARTYPAQTELDVFPSAAALPLPPYCIGDGQRFPIRAERTLLSLYGFPAAVCAEHRYMFPGVPVWGDA